MRVHLARNQRRRRNVWDGKQIDAPNVQIADGEILLLQDSFELVLEGGTVEGNALLFDVVDELGMEGGAVEGDDLLLESGEQLQFEAAR